TNATVNNQDWVFDTGCGSHICCDMQGLKNSRRLSKEDAIVRVANGAKVAALAVGIYYLALPSGLVLELNNCYYVPSLSRNIISISCLAEQDFEIAINKRIGCHISLNAIFYCSVVNSNGIYVLESNENLYNINIKRPKMNSLNPLFLWHCRLGHINESHMNKLHKSGNLGSFDYESYDTCESYLFGKMTKTPFRGK